MQPLPPEKRVPGQRVVMVVTRQDQPPIVYHGQIIPFPEGHPLKEIHERDRDLIYVQMDSQYDWLNNHGLMAFWDSDIENGFGDRSTIYSEEDFDCNHPPARQFWWYAADGTLCGGCCDCGVVLHGGAD